MIPDPHTIQAFRRDPVLIRLIRELPAPDVAWEGRPKNVFQSLVRSVVYQQLSGKAANTIHTRLLTLFPRKHVTPQRLLAIAPTQLRACGISAQKASYVHALADYFSKHLMPPRSIAHMSSTELVEHLTQIKGVGEWTVHMLLIFTLHRPDVLPTGDLGIRKGMQIAYQLDRLPSKKEMEQIAAPWREYASIASLYFWKVADMHK